MKLHDAATREATREASLRPSAPGAAHGPILVASDGTPASEPALLAARLLAARLGAPVRVVSVVPPHRMVMPAPEQVVLPGPPVEELVARRADRVREELLEVLGSTNAWPVEVCVGVPAAEVAHTAEEIGAGLVVTGLVHHDTLDRVLRGDTPLGILNRAGVPTLAVPHDVRGLPRRVLIGVDLGDASVAAARYVQALVGDAEVVHLVHVQARLDVGPPMAGPMWDAAYDEAVKCAFARVAAALSLPSSVRVETRLLMGEVAHELLRFADDNEVELLVTGHRRRPLVERMLGGSIAARLFRSATTWILMVPEGAVARAGVPAGAEEPAAGLRDRATWAAFLEDFTRRNAARRVTLEIHNHQVGAQTSVTGYPFLGIDYDPHGERVDIMLGDFEGTERHLTHTVRRVQSVQLFRTPEGHDGALLVTDPVGHTLLRVTR